MRKILALALLLLASPAWAQNPTCPTRPPGDSSNACASTAFVQNAIATPPLPHTHIFVGNSSNLAHDFGTLATFSDSGTLNLSPTANSLSKGFEIVQSGPTNGVSVGSEFAFNRIVISSEAISTGSFFDVVNALRVTHRFGGPTASGSRAAFQVDLNLDAATSPTNVNRNYVAAYLNLNINSSDGGTNTGAGALGNFTVENIVARIQPGAVNLAGVALAEWDFVSQPTSSFTSATGLLMVRWGPTAAAGPVDTAFNITTAGSGAVGWKQAFYLSSANGTTPIAAGGCVICTDSGSWSIGDVINLSTYTVTGSYFNFLNYRVDGTGYTVQANVVAPASPAAGFVTTYSDSTNLRFHDKNSAGTIGTTVVADAGATLNFLTGISTSGVISKRRPVCADLSDAAPSCSSASAISLVVGTTVIASGTTLRVLYDNGGVLGEYTNTQLTALINPATTTLSGALPAWPNNTTTFFRGDGTYTGVGIAALTGLGTGVGTALAVNVGTTGSFVVNGGALGTPSSGTATNLTGTAAGLTAGNVTTNANLTGDVTSVGNATTLTNAPVIAKVLTGYVSGAGTISATDSILSAFQKINGNDALKAPIANPTFTGTVIAPIIAGGSGAASTLTLESTAGAGTTTDSISFNTGSQLLRGSISSGGKWAIGPNAVAASSAAQLDINLSATSAGSVVDSTAALRLLSAPAGLSHSLEMDAFQAGNKITGFTAEGVLGAPTNSAISRNMFLLAGYGWSNSAAYLSSAIEMQTAEAWSNTAGGSFIDFYVTALTTKTLTQVMKMHPSTGVSIAVATDAGAGNLLIAGLYKSSLAPTAVSGAGPILIGSASTINSRMKVNLNGTDYWIPVSTTAF